MSKSTGPKPRRANGEGSLRHDKARDRWRGAVAWTDASGQLQRKAFSGKSRAEVKARMDALRRELAAGNGPASTQSLGDYLDGWLEAERQRVRPSTLRYRHGHIKNYVRPALGAVKLAALAPKHVEAMTADMVDRGLSPRTAAGCRTTLRKALHDAERDGLVTRNVAALARPPRIESREVDALSREEMRAVLAACEGDDPLGPLIVLAATTGLRQGELLGLGWDDVDLDAKTLTVRRALARAWDGGFELAEPKTQRSRRVVYLPEQAVRALGQQRERQDADRDAAGDDWQDDTDGLGLVFTDAIGRPLKPWSVTHDWHGLLDRAGVRGIAFHGLRHSYATLALASGVDLKTVSDALGHASVGITSSFYLGRVPTLGRSAADAIGRALE